MGSGYSLDDADAIRFECALLLQVPLLPTLIAGRDDKTGTRGRSSACMVRGRVGERVNHLHAAVVLHGFVDQPDQDWCFATGETSVVFDS